MRKRKATRPSRNTPNKFKKALRLVVNGRTLDLAIVVVAVAVVGYLGYLGWVLTSDYSSTRPVTDDLVRLQIVDGVGDRALMQQVKARLADIDPAAIEVELVDSTRLVSRAIPRSLLISRLEDNDPARKLAVRLGLTADDVLYRPLADNPSLISATLVIGEDFPAADLP